MLNEVAAEVTSPSPLRLVVGTIDMSIEVSSICGHQRQRQQQDEVGEQDEEHGM